jgi:uncharacterized integral membrane protein
MRKLVTVLVLIPLAIIIVVFAVANRAPVAVSLDPFNPAQPAVMLQLPLFVLAFILLGLGVLVGGVAAWLRQRRWRQRARHAESEARDLRARLDAACPRGRLPSRDTQTFAVPPAA